MQFVTAVLTALILSHAASVSAEVYKVAFIPKGATHVFWKEMARGAEDEAKARKIDMVWRGPSAEDGVDAQNGIMGIYVRSKYDGIIIAPNSQSQLAKSIDDAVAAGLKLIVVDSPLAANSPFPYVGTNNEKAGALAAKQAARDFPKTKKILLFRYSEMHGSTSERETGFQSAIKKLLPKALVVDSYYSGVTVEEAENKLAEILKEHKDIDLLFTPNESGTEGSIKAVKAASLSGKVKHYGFDFNVAINDALKSNALNGVVIQDPYQMGRKAMQFMHDTLQKKSIPKTFETPAVMVTKANLSSPVIKAKTDPFLSASRRNL